MSEEKVIRAIKGIFLFIAFLVMGVSIPDANIRTLVYLQEMGISPRAYQLLFFISAFANLIIGMRGTDWNALWFAVWVTYSAAALFGYLNGSGTPLLAVSAYLLLSVMLTIDVLHDAEVFKYLGKKLWHKREVLSQH